MIIFISDSYILNFCSIYLIRKNGFIFIVYYLKSILFNLVGMGYLKIIVL